MVLAALLGVTEARAGGYQRGKSFSKRDASYGDQRVVGAVWFPVEDDVMMGGHLSDRSVLDKKSLFASFFFKNAYYNYLRARRLPAIC